MSMDNQFKVAVRVVARSEGLPVRMITRPRCRRAQYARWRAVYLLCVCEGLSQVRVARLFRTSRRSVQRALACVEEVRDIAVADAAISQIEEDYRHALAA